MLITPRDSIAHDAPLVTRQGILRRLSHKRIATMFLSEPRWSDASRTGVLEFANVYNGDIAAIANVALLAYSTPRARNDALAAPLREAGIEVHPVGDCLSPRDMLAATADGHAAGNAI